MQIIEQAIQAICQELYDTAVSVQLARTDPEFGDFATNIALQLAKPLGQNPRQIAQSIADQLPADLEGIVTDATVAGPGFINIRVSSSYASGVLVKAVAEAPFKIYGASDSGLGQTVLCEFPCTNIAKPFSVGHIRSAVQGWAVHQLMRLMGYTVITDNHLGDYGTSFGKWVVGFLQYSSQEQLAKDGIYELSRVYIAITQALKDETAADGHELADEVQDWLKRLEAGDPQAIAYSSQFKEISLKHLHTVMDRLGISTEFELGESFYIARGQELVNELVTKGIARESEGAIVVDLDEYGIKTPIIIRKANGAALYATSDLATIEYRQTTWHPFKVFIHTGQEQAFYFRQLKALALKCGYEDVIVHLWHGLVEQKHEDGSRGKMSSRQGVVLLEDLLDKAEAKATELMKEGDSDDSHAVAMGAIKFADFTGNRTNSTLFDWETIFNVQGFSGPAVQYAAVRIASILAKAEPDASLDDNYDWQSEHELIMKLLEFPQLLKVLHDNYELQKLAAYLYELARELNRYYETTPILKATAGQGNKLWLLGVTQQVLTTGLSVLGIAVPKRM